MLIKYNSEIECENIIYLWNIINSYTLQEYNMFYMKIKNIIMNITLLITILCENYSYFFQNAYELQLNIHKNKQIRIKYSRKCLIISNYDQNA